MNRRLIFILLSFLILNYTETRSQGIDSVLGWYGHEIIADSNFYNTSKWTANAQTDNECFATASDTSLNLHWRIAGGNYRWVQIYYSFSTAISLQNTDIFGFDVMGTSCSSGNACHANFALEFKFENGPRHAILVRNGESGLLGIDRWVERLFFLKNDNDFFIDEGFNWDSITVFSIAVRSNPDYLIVQADSGIVSFRNFIGDATSSWDRAIIPESIDTDLDSLKIIKKNAADFILSRQKSTGLLTTWAEDGSSWLYGQGLALKVLSIEGIWSNGIPQNNYALAAEKLAHFLANNQQSKGYWARSWNSNTGAVNVLYESYDSSIWMGDFPWIITGLSSYYKKTCDQEVTEALGKAETFLKSQVSANGKFYTINVFNNKKIEVSSTEAYIAAIGAFFEIGDSIDAWKLIHYIDQASWNSDLGYWNEGTYSDRVVLFANTWMSQMLYSKGYETKAMDALSFAGKLLFTRGPGLPYGLDGIGPVATWFEGTLTYICAGGPGSRFLFNNIRPYINSDGSVPHYNDDIGGAGGIWAVKWSSLDGTSWLYFAASESSPFKILTTEVNCSNALNEVLSNKNDLLVVYPSPGSGTLHIAFPETTFEQTQFYIKDSEGRTFKCDSRIQTGSEIELDVSGLAPGVYFLTAKSKSIEATRKFILY
jgi:hypothetical protein